MQSLVDNQIAIVFGGNELARCAEGDSERPTDSANDLELEAEWGKCDERLRQHTRGQACKTRNGRDHENNTWNANKWPVAARRAIACKGEGDNEQAGSDKDEEGVAERV